MRPTDLTTKIFLDGGDPAETRRVFDFLGFLDGQTTNPSLIAKSPGAQERLSRGEKFTQQEVWKYYRKTIEEIRAVMPTGSISIEVYGDLTTTADHMMVQADHMNTWISGAHIKLPTTAEGLKAARMLVDKGLNVNMTLVFSQQQAAAVYAATTGAKKGQVFLSPFIGRLDDIGENGMDLIRNVIEMYKTGDGHVEVLVASVRSMDHFNGSLALAADIITAPAKWLEAWKDGGMAVPDTYSYVRPELAPMPFEEISLAKDSASYNVHHPLTDKGLAQFVSDWNALIV